MRRSSSGAARQGLGIGGNPLSGENLIGLEQRQSNGAGAASRFVRPRDTGIFSFVRVFALVECPSSREQTEGKNVNENVNENVNHHNAPTCTDHREEDK